MPFRAHGPEPCASAYSATRAGPTGVGSEARVQGLLEGIRGGGD